MDSLNCKAYSFELEASNGICQRYIILDSTRDMTEENILNIVAKKYNAFKKYQWDAQNIKINYYTVDDMFIKENMSGSNILVF